MTIYFTNMSLRGQYSAFVRGLEALNTGRASKGIWSVLRRSIAGLAAVLSAQIALGTSVIGVAVDELSDGANVVGNTVQRADVLGGREAIEYFIPLGGSGGIYEFGRLGVDAPASLKKSTGNRFGLNTTTLSGRFC